VRDWEAEALAAERLGVRVACMRTGIVLGPGGGAVAKMRGVPAVRRRAARQRPAVGAWIHRDDAVAAYAAAVTDERYAGPITW